MAASAVWYVHVCVSKDADTIPGKAAAIYDGKKAKTYSGQANFVRINAASLHFLSRILPLEAEGTAGLTRALHCPASHGHWRVHTCTCCRGDTHHALLTREPLCVRIYVVLEYVPWYELAGSHMRACS